MNSPVAPLPASPLSLGPVLPSDSNADIPAPANSTKAGTQADFLGLLLLLLPGLNLPSLPSPEALANPAPSRATNAPAPTSADPVANAVQAAGILTSEATKSTGPADQDTPTAQPFAMPPPSNLGAPATNLVASNVDASASLPVVPTTMPTPEVAPPTNSIESRTTPVAESAQNLPTPPAPAVAGVQSERPGDGVENITGGPSLPAADPSPMNPIAEANVSPSLPQANLTPALFVFADSKISADPDKHAEDNAKASTELAAVTDQPSHVAVTPKEDVKPATMVDQVHETFRSHLDQIQQQGRVEVHLDLHPPELGRMQVHLSMEDNHLSVRMIVQDENARRVLDQQLEPLRVRFNEMGVSLGQLDVRRDGGNPHQEPPPEFNDRTAPSTPVSNRKGGRTNYGQVAAPTALIDVMA